MLEKFWARRRFTSIERQGLRVVSVEIVQVSVETRPRLALLCKYGEEIVAVVIVQSKKNFPFYYLYLLELEGHMLKARVGYAFKDVTCQIDVQGETVTLPLLIAKEVEATA